MDKKHYLGTLVGMNPNTARKLFTQLGQEFEYISWTSFRRFTGRDLRCFDEDSRWISGDIIRAYFAEFINGQELGDRLMKLYDIKFHKPSLDAYAA